LGKVGIDFSVLETDLRQWLGNNFTPYPALAEALLHLLEGTRLRKPVYLDVIVWNYEHSKSVAVGKEFCGDSARAWISQVPVAQCLSDSLVAPIDQRW
jgi:hypothetical protein